MLSRKLHPTCLSTCIKLNMISTLRFLSSDNSSNMEYGLEKKWAYYNQEAIDREASKPLVLLSPTQLMFAGRSSDGKHLLKSSQYLQKELPRRIARRVKDFQSLPYVVAINPTLQEVYELYLRAFHKLSTFPTITNLEEERAFSLLISQLLDNHKDVVTMLATSFHQVRSLIPYELLGSLTERTLTSRLRIRLLAEHHLQMKQNKPGYIGIVSVDCSPKSVVEKAVYNCKHLCETAYGLSPAVFVSGHTKARFPAIPAPLEYILQELIKNSMKATVQAHSDKRKDMPPVKVTLCNNDTHFMIKISDQGGGIPDDRMTDIFKYSFSTTKQEQHANDMKTDSSPFDQFMQRANSTSFGGSLSGYGFGLPTANAYAQFLGGSLTLVPMSGLGTDVFLKLSHITNQNSFRI